MEMNNNHLRLLERRVDELERQLVKRDETIQDLMSQLDKYRSVMPVAGPGAAATGAARRTSGSGCSVTSSQSVIGQKQRTHGVSAEPQHLMTCNLDELQRDTLRTYLKTARSVDVIRQAIQSNDFMKHFSTDQLQQIVDCMYPVEFKKDTVIIREGDVGSRVYVLKEGQVDIYKDATKLSSKGPNTVLGELAILYNCTRTATVKAVDYCKLWAIDRHVFQTVMMQSELLRQQQCVDWLRRIPRLKDLSEDVLRKILDAMEEVHYKSGETIVKQGAQCDSLYIVSKGKAKETRRHSGLIKDDTLIRHLEPGDFFNERVLETQEIRLTNVTSADSNGVDCLLIDRTSFNQLLNKLQQDVTSDSHVTSSSNETKPQTTGKPTSNGEHSTGNIEPPCSVNQYNDVVVITTIGVGGFGRVQLVRLRHDASGKTYALKQMKKIHVVETCQQEHIMNEKCIMSEARSDFIVRLHKTFKDAKYLYMLMEVCLGGELWTLLRDKISFDESMARFYCACVVEAFTYLHARSIIYRDLKPENLLVDHTGYIKLVDFGFAKKIGSGRKTWTFCGTPEYVAPEIILNKGHDTSADLWSLGIPTYELLTGSPPFTSSEPMKTYNMILKGITAVDFPRGLVSKNAQSFIKKLCRTDPIDRLGYGSNGMRDVHKHKWFDGLNWDALRRRTAKAPYVPKIKSFSDTSNFDSYPTDEAGAPADDLTGWDDDF